MNKYTIRFLIAVLVLLCATACKKTNNKEQLIEKGYNSCVEYNNKVVVLLSEYKITIPKVYGYRNSIDGSVKKEDLEICIKQKKEYNQTLNKHKIPRPEDKTNEDVVASMCGDCGEKLKQCSLNLKKTRKAMEKYERLNIQLTKLKAQLEKQVIKKNRNTQSKPKQSRKPVKTKKVSTRNDNSEIDHSEVQRILTEIEKMRSIFSKPNITNSNITPELDCGLHEVVATLCNTNEVVIEFYPCKDAGCKSIRRVRRIKKECANKQCRDGAKILYYRPNGCKFGPNKKEVAHKLNSAKKKMDTIIEKP